MSIFKKKGGQISATSIPMTEAEAALAQSDFNIEKITEIQNKFTGGVVLLVPGRIFIREGLLWKVCRKGIKKRQFFLFNDILVYGSVVASRYSNQHSLPLDKMSVSSECFYQPRVQSDFDADAESLDQQLDPSNAFQISHADKSFHVFASSSADKANWLANLTKHISRAAQSVADSPQQMVTRPVWVPDAVAKECMICQTRFSTFVRKHHCRRCGRVVCSSCSPHHVSLNAAESALSGHTPNENSKLERVCKECFKEMTAQHNRSNSQSRPSRDSKVSPSPTITASGGALPIIGQATIIKPPDQDSTDTEDSDDSSDEKEKQSAVEEQSNAGPRLVSSAGRRQSGTSSARTEHSSMAEEATKEKGELETAACLRQLSMEGDEEREEEAQPTPPPRKKKLEKLLRKQIEESQKLTKKEESSLDDDTEEQNVAIEETDNTTTPPDTTPRKARRKNKHSKPQDSALPEQEAETMDNHKAGEEVNDGDQGQREPSLKMKEATMKEKETVGGVTAASEDTPTIIAADKKPEGEADQEHSPSASQKRSRGRRKKFKTATGTNERTDDAAPS